MTDVRTGVAGGQDLQGAGMEERAPGEVGAEGEDGDTQTLVWQALAHSLVDKGIGV